MAIHHISCRATSSGVDNLESITASMDWLAGDNVDLNIDKSASYYGSKIYIISFKISKNKLLRNFIERLTDESKVLLSKSIEDRIDENKILHFRLKLSSLIDGKIEICTPLERSVKCEIKIEVYPGQNLIEQAGNIFT